MRVLIIDDDPVNRLYFQEILAEKARIQAAASGLEGLAAFTKALAEDDPFDAVLADICMPGMDGHQTLQKLRSLEREHGRTGDRETTVLMISALSDSRNVSRAFFQGGAVSYLVKPVSRKALLEELAKFGLMNEAQA